jgi:hypothetical protein
MGPCSGRPRRPGESAVAGTLLRMDVELAPGELELLIAGLSDDVAFVWVLIRLGIRENPPVDPGPPSRPDVDAAFDALERLSVAGLVKVGRTEYRDGGPPGRLAPVRHVEEPLALVRARVDEACSSGTDWEWACWVVNTADGDAVAHRALERPGFADRFTDPS